MVGEGGKREDGRGKIDSVVEEGGSAWEVILPHSLGWVFYTTLLLWLIHAVHFSNFRAL